MFLILSNLCALVGCLFNPERITQDESRIFLFIFFGAIIQSKASHLFCVSRHSPATHHRDALWKITGYFTTEKVQTQVLQCKVVSGSVAIPGPHESFHMTTFFNALFRTKNPLKFLLFGNDQDSWCGANK